VYRIAAGSHVKEDSGKPEFQILVIEDQTRHQKIFQDTFLTELNAAVRFATTGEEGLEFIAGGGRPDLVVLDLDLPRISGREVLRQIKADIRTRLIPVIILTGSSSQIVEMDLLENGAEDYLEKGSHPDILVSRIRAQIRHKKAIDRLQQLAIDRDIFAAGVLANINSTHKTLFAQSEQVQGMLAENPEGRRQEIFAMMDEMCEHASRLGQFANDVIQSVRDSHRRTNPQNVSLAEYVGIVNSVPPPSREDKVGIEFQPVGTLGTIHVDPDYFRIVMMNIIQNITERASRQQTQGGSRKVPVEISVRPAVMAGTNGAVDVVVRDFGDAIPPEKLATLFEPRIAGTGIDDQTTFDISLAVVSNAVRKIGGQIRAESPGDNKGGSEFHLILPIESD
jgi:DNA-binding response OmpR family regulator